MSGKHDQTGGQAESLCVLSRGLRVWVEAGQKGKGGAGLSQMMRPEVEGSASVKTRKQVCWDGDWGCYPIAPWPVMLGTPQ